ncbi:MAG: hypothetical protein PWQ97_449 [Tepidanaerobacteraceae bacterium]|nr:hypothetical protein [Tepidanaerobacteraceae bacterium]
MMYCTLDDIKNQVPEDVLIDLTDDNGTGAINETIVDKAIIDAQEEIDVYASKLYTVPFNPVPGIIKKLAVDIAVYNLFSRRGFDQESADSVILQRYKSAIKLLENLSVGTATIGTPPSSPPARTVYIEGTKRVFSRKRLEGF